MSSKVVAISEQPMFYDVLIKALKDADCLTETPEEYHERRDKQAQGDSSKTFNTDAERCDLTENEISACTDIILGRDEEDKNENSPFSSIYTVGYRNDVCMSLSGFFYWSHITQASAEIVIKRIAEETNDGSADVNKAVGNVVAAYKRADSRRPS
ncbi:MAG: hypothetical protein M3P08_15830 [Thermoproteota archaeon]|nr:hypothetical protein [Thermoproteota archaeon]